MWGYCLIFIKVLLFFVGNNFCDLYKIDSFEDL